MSAKYHLFFSFFCLITTAVYCQNNGKVVDRISAIHYQEIKTDSFFDSRQIINIFTIDKKDLAQFSIEFAYEKTILKPTSEFAEEHQALAAINGTFYDMDEGGSVTYLEENDSMIHANRRGIYKYGVSEKLTKAAIVVNKNGKISLEKAMLDNFYRKSKAEKGVMVGAPMLLKDGVPSSLPDMKFVHNRHPRTCICEREKDWFFITIDGRQIWAEGMSLPEVQTYLLAQKCINAINLDGGGSTTMWLKGKGVVNHPSDLFGERKVANVLIIK